MVELLVANEKVAGSNPVSRSKFCRRQNLSRATMMLLCVARGRMGIMWHVYILKCSDSSLYTGISANVITRVLTHNKGKGSKYTRPRKPVELIYTEEFKTRSEALKE